ncbi:MAG TPA: hypothetical protein VF292_01630 [Rhodanobacteraceae bacterium]
MLDAWARGKGDWSHPLEDEVLSAAFGHLKYMSLAARRCAALALLSGAFEQDTFPAANSVDACDIELWPNLAGHGRDESRVEPDVVITFGERENPSIVLLIEAKWDAPQGTGQLFKQWSAARKRYRDAELWHLFLTRSSCTVEEMLRGAASDGLHARNLRSVTWSWLAQRMRVASQSADVSSKSSSRDEFQSWADTACKFFARLGQAPFEGVAAVARRHEGVPFANTWCFRERLVHVDKLIESIRNVITIWRDPPWKFQISKK